MRCAYSVGILLLLLLTSKAKTPNSCSITKHGASPTSADNAKAIQAALNECKGGGTVTLSGGAYKSGPLVVSGTDVSLIVETGASLVTAYGPDKWPQSGGAYIDVLVFDKCMNCSLSGGGTLFGRGGRPPNGDDWYYLFDEGKITASRPHYLRIQDCVDFTLRARDTAGGGGGGRLTILDAPKFNCVISNSSYVEIDGLNITSTWYVDPKSGDLKEPHNTDGIDPGSNSHHVHIHNVHISNGDDSVAVKPGYGSGCTHSILVENSYFTHGHGCSIGSVGEGCVRDVIFRNITMEKQQNGCRVKTYITDKPGTVHNISWEGITMKDVGKCITVNANYKKPPSHPKQFVSVSTLSFANIEGTGCGSDGITTDNVQSSGQAPAEFICPKQSPCTGIVLTNVHLEGKSSKDSCEYAHGETHGHVVPPSCLLPPHSVLGVGAVKHSRYFVQKSHLQ